MLQISIYARFFVASFCVPAPIATIVTVTILQNDYASYRAARRTCAGRSGLGGGH